MQNFCNPELYERDLNNLVLKNQKRLASAQALSELFSQAVIQPKTANGSHTQSRDHPSPQYTVRNHSILQRFLNGLKGLFRQGRKTA